MRRFYFHYNKPASQKAGRVKWSVHFAGKCHIVDQVECFRSCQSKVNNRQPYAVMRGMAKIVYCTVDTSGDRIATIS